MRPARSVPHERTGFLPAAVRTSLADIVACTGAAVIESADLSAIISGVAPLDEAGLANLPSSIPGKRSAFGAESRHRLFRHAG